MAVPTSYQSLLRTAGFSDVATTDLTAGYASTQRRWIDATERHATAVREMVGADEYEERAVSRQKTLRAIRDGLLSRFMYTAVR